MVLAIAITATIWDWLSRRLVLRVSGIRHPGVTRNLVARRMGLAS
ncbi:MAG: hypothetical protein V3S51_05825 [Dehalococcoidia bacterium]